MRLSVVVVALGTFPIEHGQAVSAMIECSPLPGWYMVALEEHEHLPLEAFRKKRDEVIAEVIRAKTRHWDNVITTTEDLSVRALRSSSSSQGRPHTQPQP